MTSRMATTMFNGICLATVDTKHLYHTSAGCNYCIPGLFAMSGIAISNDSGAIKCQTRDGKDQEMGGKEKWEMGEGESEEEKQESVHLHGRHVTKFLTNSCMFAYE